MLLDKLPLSETYKITFHICDFWKRTASWLRNEMLDVKFIVQKVLNPLSSVIELAATYQLWVCSIFRCYQRLWRASLTDFFYELFDLYIMGEVLMQVNAAQMSGLNRQEGKWLLLQLFSMHDPNLLCENS